MTPRGTRKRRWWAFVLPAQLSWVALASTVLLALVTPSFFAAKRGPLVVHEWGTFTSLQDEDGKAVAGINTDDEPVPAFVHDIAKRLLLRSTEAPPTFFKGAPSCHPDVTMRLETPVLYIHAGKEPPQKVDVEVSFQGGWLTQFYPSAEVVAPGVEPDAGRYGPLTSQTVSKLTWSNLNVNGGGRSPVTEDHVWLAPRKVDASMLQSQAGEAEKFLFYRGVGLRDAPLRVVRDSRRQTLQVLQNNSDRTEAASLAGMHTLWLADVRPDGAVAYRALHVPDRVEGTDEPLVTTSASFEPSDYGKARTEALRGELKTALVADGLFADEAEALLSTWELSYFKSAGLRLFFLVPSAWTDAVLPLKINGAQTARRVMVGRIDLITPQHRQLLRTIAETTAAEPWKDLAETVLPLYSGKNNEFSDLSAGRRTFEELGLTPPPSYKSYLALGRFRNAMILDEEKRNPSPALKNFIQSFGLGGYQALASAR